MSDKFEDVFGGERGRTPGMWASDPGPEPVEKGGSGVWCPGCRAQFGSLMSYCPWCNIKLIVFESLRLKRIQWDAEEAAKEKAQEEKSKDASQE